MAAATPEPTLTVVQVRSTIDEARQAVWNLRFAS